MDGLNKYYDKGLAVGRSDIRQDCLHFRFYEEVFIVTQPIKTKKVKDYLIAPVKEVRKASHG